MSRPHDGVPTVLKGFPRVSGDEPLAHGVQIDGDKFSPRERG